MQSLSICRRPAPRAVDAKKVISWNSRKQMILKEKSTPRPIAQRITCKSKSETITHERFYVKWWNRPKMWRLLPLQGASTLHRIPINQLNLLTASVTFSLSDVFSSLPIPDISGGDVRLSMSACLAVLSIQKKLLIIAEGNKLHHWG